MPDKEALIGVEARENMFEVIQRAQAGDATALPALHDILDRVPRIRELLGSDIDKTVEHFISKSLSGEKNLAFPEGVKRKLKALREELEGPSPSATERLLVDRVVACWLQVQEADLRYSQLGDCSFAKAAFHLKRQDHAHQRFLSAMKTLATVRKLAIPMLQVNIGSNQLNVASNPPA